jgi:hypothetical protein
MTVTIISNTNLSIIEDTIESWIVAASVLPDVLDSDGNILPKVRREGYGMERKRPYASMDIISQVSPGQPDETKVLFNDAGTDKYKSTFDELTVWTTQISFFSDSFNEDGSAVSSVARHYAQRLVNNWKTQPIRNILDAQGIAVHPINETIRGNILPAVDDDKYIQQAIVEYQFSFVDQTDVVDTDYFLSIVTPTEDNGGLIFSEGS